MVSFSVTGASQVAKKTRLLDRPAKNEAPAKNPFTQPEESSQAPERSSDLFKPQQTAEAPNPFSPPSNTSGAGKSGFFPPGTKLGGTSGASSATGQAPVVENALTLASLSAARTAAIAALPPGANAAFVTLWNALESSRQSKLNMLTLLDQGALSPKGEQTSALEHLRDLAEKPRVYGLDGPELAKQTLSMLSNPDDTVFQGKRYTCSVANIQRQMADDPATFASLVEGLSSREGRASLPSGDAIERAEGSVGDDGSGRNDVDRLVQGAFMSMASGKGRYNPETDRFEGDQVPGLKPLEVTAAVEGKDQVVVVHDEGTHAEFERLVRTHGANDSFQLGVSWNDTDHMLLLKKVEGDVAHYFNPETHSAGTMPLAEILFKSQMAIFDGTQVDSAALPEDAQYWFRRAEQEGDKAP